LWWRVVAVVEVMAVVVEPAGSAQAPDYP